MRTFVMGDIHGNYKALLQCLERSGFDYRHDRLIQLGDVVDRFGQSYECVEELLKINDIIVIKGNHDDWFIEFIQTGFHPQNWQQGGSVTAISYLKHTGKEAEMPEYRSGYKTSLTSNDIPDTHRRFFEQMLLYFIDESNNCFVHAGFNRHLEFKEQASFLYYWDRDLWTEALSHESANKKNPLKRKFEMQTSFNNIFIGHTPTLHWKTDKPMHAGNIYNIDTGAGHTGRLTLMDVRTKEYWQSDTVAQLYERTY